MIPRNTQVIPLGSRGELRANKGHSRKHRISSVFSPFDSSRFVLETSVSTPVPQWGEGLEGTRGTGTDLTSATVEGFPPQYPPHGDRLSSPRRHRRRRGRRGSQGSTFKEDTPRTRIPTGQTDADRQEFTKDPNQRVHDSTPPEWTSTTHGSH